MFIEKLLAGMVLTMVAGLGWAAAEKTQSQWDSCVAQAEGSVDQRQVGTLGVETKIKQMCGTPPDRGATVAQGAQPYDVVRSKQWRPKFISISKNKYAALVERLTVASPITRDGTWLIGSGILPHGGGSDEAAIAIDAKTQEVFAAMLEDGTKLTTYGFKTAQEVPPFLRAWMQAHKP